jgi:hypothetical protein
MWSSRTGSSRRLQGRRLTAWAALAVGWLLPSAGCQVEYAGMTLPSGKYMHDDVQYFAPGPSFPWANTQAATQRARMQAMGIEPAGVGPLTAPVPPGAEPAVQNQEGRPTDTSASPLPRFQGPGEPNPGVVPPPGDAAPVPPPPAAGIEPGAVPAPAGGVPAQPAGPQ